MSEMQLIYVTEARRIAGDPHDYLARLLSGRPDGLLIREKHLSDDALLRFTAPLIPIAESYGVPLILRGTPALAKHLGIRCVQLSYAEAVQLLAQADGNTQPPAHKTTDNDPLRAGDFDNIGVSVHSLAEARHAEALGASRLTFGHIFTSSCKPGLPPRGLTALDELVRACTIPVYAIGGINADTLPFLLPIHPQGACLMSAAMTDPQPETLTTRLRRILEQA